MVRALANVLLLPWPAIPDQKWDDRARHLAKFLRDLTEPFRALRTVPDFGSNREMQQQGESSVFLQHRVLVCDGPQSKSGKVAVNHKTA